MSKAAPGSDRNSGDESPGRGTPARRKAGRKAPELARPSSRAGYRCLCRRQAFRSPGHSPRGRLSLAFAQARGNATSPPRQEEARTLSSLDRFAAEKLSSLEARQLRRRLAETAREDGITVTRDGKRLLSFSCNDYLNLSQHPDAKAAAIAAIRRFGAGAGASRLVTGNHPLYAELESRLAKLKGTEAAFGFRLGLFPQNSPIPP